MFLKLRVELKCGDNSMKENIFIGVIIVFARVSVLAVNLVAYIKNVLFTIIVAVVTSRLSELRFLIETR